MALEVKLVPLVGCWCVSVQMFPRCRNSYMTQKDNCACFFLAGQIRDNFYAYTYIKRNCAESNTCTCNLRNLTAWSYSLTVGLFPQIRLLPFSLHAVITPFQPICLYKIKPPQEPMPPTSTGSNWLLQTPLFNVVPLLFHVIWEHGFLS